MIFLPENQFFIREARTKCSSNIEYREEAGRGTQPEKKENYFIKITLQP